MQKEVAMEVEPPEAHDIHTHRKSAIEYVNLQMRICLSLF